MTLALVLVVVAVSQLVLLVALGAFVLGKREQERRREAVVAARARELGPALARWLAGHAPVHPVVVALGTLPVQAALAQTVQLVQSRVPSTLRPALARGVRDQPWARRVLRGAHSARWWQRLDAARLLGAVGGPEDAALARALLADPHPAVLIAAAPLIETVPDAALIAEQVEAYPDRAPAMQQYLLTVFRRAWQPTEDALLDRLVPEAPVARLVRWIALAEALETPALLARLVPLIAHPEVQVRAAAARALRRYHHPAAAQALLPALDDPSEFVRSRAAQALGALRVVDAVPALRHALQDRAWWVRYRAAMSLAQLGEPGRAALRGARSSPDTFAREMATMVSGLSDGAVLEGAEA